MAMAFFVMMSYIRGVSDIKGGYPEVVHNCFMRFDYLLLTGTLFIDSSCGQADKLNSDNELVTKIQKEVTSGQASLDLGKITDFEWDSLLILTPYTRPNDIEVQFNIDLSLTKHSMIEHLDHINQLIFFSNGTPTKMVEYPRYPGDFVVDKIKFIPKDSAVFDIVVTEQKTDSGNSWIRLLRR